MNVSFIRHQFASDYINNRFVTDKSGCKMLELLGASFLATEDTIFGEPNYDYIRREIEWYESQSLDVSDIPGETPAIWNEVSDAYGIINSNYGYLIYSDRNGSQYDNVLDTLRDNPDSRQGTMVYTRPSIHRDAYLRGRSDFICTNSVSYFIRDNRLHCIVNMRSNDVIFGYRNDIAWQQHVLNKLAEDLDIKPGSITWQVASLHIYERHFNYVEEFISEQ